MKKIIWFFIILSAAANLGLAQQNNTAPGGGANVILKAGSKISGRLNDALDAEKTKNSDDFVLKLSDEIKGGGIIIEKGAELLGRVVRVQTVSADDNTSEISLFFDFVKTGDDFLTFKASVISITTENDAKETPDKKASPFKTEISPIFKGATVISIKGKNLMIDAGMVFHLRLDQDLVKP